MPADDAPHRSPRGSAFADAAAARRATELVRPMIEPCLRDSQIVGSGFLYVVVMDPALGPADGVAFEDAILHEQAFGDEARWDADYRAFARDKARLAWRRGEAGLATQAVRPQALRGGESLLAGAACVDGIVVAASGAHPMWDEAFATAVAASLGAIARQRHAEARAADRLRA